MIGEPFDDQEFFSNRCAFQTRRKKFAGVSFPPASARGPSKHRIQWIERVFLWFVTKVAAYRAPECSIAVSLSVIIGIARIEVQQDDLRQLRVPDERLGDRFDIDPIFRHPPTVVPSDAI